MSKSTKYAISGTGRWGALRFAVLVLALCLLQAPGAFAAPAAAAQAGNAASKHRIQGTVVDQAGAPVIGANVIVEGTTTGTTTDVKGAFSLEVPAKGRLQVSYLGYETQLVTLTSQTQYVVTLQENAAAIADVVVVGYATVKRRDVVGSVASVNAETLQQMPVASVAEAMTGRMAGVQITATEGDPDAEIRIRVRGAGTFSSDGAPLYIVDGFPVESISDISSSEIQSIDILKDAFSTAIYGSRGANGVVLITTKSGEKGKINVNYNVYWGFKDIARKNQVQALNPSEFAKWQYELAAVQNKVSDNYEPYFGAFSDIDLYDNVKGNDWMDQLFGRTGEQFNHNLTVSGGGDKFKWNATYARLYDKAIMVGSNYSRDNLGLKTQFKPNKRITLDFNIRYSRMKVRGAGANSLNDSGAQTTGRLKNAMLYTPIPLKAQIEGGDDLEENSSDAVMPTVAVSDSDRKRERTNWTANGGFTWEIVDNLNLKVEAGMEEYRQETNSFYGVTTYYSKVGGSGSTVPGTPSTNYNDVTRRRVRNTNTLSYDFKKLISNDNHHLNVLLGQEYIITEQRTFNTWVDGLPDFYTAEQAWAFMGAGSNASSSNMNYAADDILLSYFGRVNYDFKGKYMVSATMRGDGSSKFSKGQKWGYFPSAAASWRISDEWGLKDLRWLDNLKLRYSFGTAGNNNIPTGMGGLTQLYEVGTGSSFIYGDPTYWTPNGNGASESYMANANLTWETTDLYNAAIDASLFKKRLNITFEAYISKTRDLLLSVQKAAQSGYTSHFENIGRTSNKGVELTVETRNIVKPKFSWSTSLTLSHNKQMVEDIGSEDFVSAMNSPGNSQYMMYGYVKGRPLNALWGFKYGGVWHNQEEIERNKVTNTYVSATTSLSPGLPRYIDTNNDGSLDQKDLVYLGNADPTIYGGLQNTFNIGQLKVGVYFAYSLGGKIYNYSELYMAGTYSSNQYRYMANSWHPVRNPDSDLPRAGAVQVHVPSDLQVHDASYLRLKNVSVGYTFDLRKRVKWLRDITLSVSGENLYLWSKYNGFDPDVSTSSESSTLRRVDMGAYPRARTVIFSVQIRY